MNRFRLSPPVPSLQIAFLKRKHCNISVLSNGPVTRNDLLRLIQIIELTMDDFPESIEIGTDSGQPFSPSPAPNDHH